MPLSDNTNKPKNLRPLRFLGPSGGAVLFYCLYFAIILLPSVFAFFVFGDFSDGLLLTFGKSTALTAFTIFCLQVLLGARLKTLDRLAGLDKILQFHRIMAIVGTILILAHPIAVMMAYEDFSLVGFRSSMPIIFAEIALIILLTGVLFALLRAKLKIDYNLWHLFHKVMLLVVILGFIHSIAIGSDIHSATKYLWWAIFAIAILAFSFRNIVFPMFIRKRYRISNIEQENHNTYTITLKPSNGKIPTYHPGQFMFLKLIRRKTKSEEHPFTISSSPTQEGFISATIKESGNFTNTIGKTTTEDFAKVAMPYGKFSFVHDQPKRFLLIAGGVGITPIISMVRYLRDTEDDRHVVVLSANRTEEDILFKAELDALPPNFRTVHILSHPDESWLGYRGRIDSAIILKEVGENLSEFGVYLCGPAPMMKSVEKELRKCGYMGKIRTEKFGF